MANEYERDEFDEIAAAGGPVGVHRAPRPWWHLVVAPVAIFLAAGLVAYLFAVFVWNTGDGGTDTASSPTAAATASADPSASPDASEAPASESPEPSPEPSETEEPPPPADMSTPVAVLNGTFIQGLAGDQAQVLQDAGFTAVTAANLTSDEPESNRVVYAEESQITTAQQVASALGIDAVEQGTPTSDADIEVQIVEDPR